MIDRMAGLIEQPVVIERALQAARDNSLKSLEPERAALAKTQDALRENQEEIDKLVVAITAGGVGSELLSFLNRRAKDLKMTREQLLAEQRRLVQVVAPAQEAVDGRALRKYLADFQSLAKATQPEELQKIIRLAVKRIQWGPDGKHKVLFYSLPLNAQTKQGPPPFPSKNEKRGEEPWFDLNRWSDTSGRGRTDTSEETGF
jgi:hypothetical protein